MAATATKQFDSDESEPHERRAEPALGFAQRGLVVADGEDVECRRREGGLSMM